MALCRGLRSSYFVRAPRSCFACCRMHSTPITRRVERSPHIHTNRRGCEDVRALLAELARGGPRSLRELQAVVSPPQPADTMIAFVWKLSLLSLSVVSLLWLFSFTSPAAAASLAKLAKFGSGFLTMALSTDKRFKAPKEDPDLIKGAADAVTKRVIFIR